MEWLFEREREKNHETYSICPRHGIDKESFRHDDVQHDCRGEQARTRCITPHRSSLLRGHSPSVTEDVTIMSQEGFQLSSDAALPSIAYHRSDSPQTQSFFFPSLLVMSARMWKERTSDSQVFDSIQGNYSHFILSVCHTFFAPLGNNTRTDLILRIKAKLNHRADSQGAQPALVTDLYELSTLSERLIILRSDSSEPLLDHRQSDILDREGWFHPFPHCVLVP
jgi:hypothetical protein